MKNILLITVVFLSLSFIANCEFLEFHVDHLETDGAVKLESITAVFIEKDYVMVVADGHYFEVRPVRRLVNLSSVGECLKKDHRNILYDQIMERLETVGMTYEDKQMRVRELNKLYDPQKTKLSTLIKKFKDSENQGFEDRIHLAYAYRFIISLDDGAISVEGFRKLDR